MTPTQHTPNDTTPTIHNANNDIQSEFVSAGLFFLSINGSSPNLTFFLLCVLETGDSSSASVGIVVGTFVIFVVAFSLFRFRVRGPEFWFCVISGSAASVSVAVFFDFFVIFLLFAFGICVFVDVDWVVFGFLVCCCWSVLCCILLLLII